MFDSRPHRVVAAGVAIAYIAIQSFQWYVFSRLPTPVGPVQALLQGPSPLNVARAVLMLLSFFALAYLFLVVCAIAFQRRPLLAVTAFLGFLGFCLLEVQLRSVELFYVFLELPSRYAAAASAAERAQLLDAYVIGPRFDELYVDLYLPLVYLTFGPIVAWLLLSSDRSARATDP